MRMILLSALFALGVGFAGATSASAAPISGVNTETNSSSMLTEIQYYRRHCRSVRVCRRGPYGRRCHIERICRRW